jgi:hydrogenase nickel incorporation protein HypA/HybF
VHELPIVGEVVKIALRHAEKHNARRIVRIHLIIGDLTNLVHEWVQRYFDFVAKETIGCDAQLVIERVPIIVLCDICKKPFTVNKKNANFKCPDCGELGATLLSGREFRVASIEIE